jgi:hypothetical protein
MNLALGCIWYLVILNNKWYQLIRFGYTRTWDLVTLGWIVTLDYNYQHLEHLDLTLEGIWTW